MSWLRECSYKSALTSKAVNCRTNFQLIARRPLEIKSTKLGCGEVSKGVPALQYFLSCVKKKQNIETKLDFYFSGRENILI